MQKYLILGLGNIGAEYANTRHNIGFDVVAAFVHKHAGSFATDRLATVSSIKLKGKLFVCICPTTYMNLSGKAFKYWLDKEQVPLDHTLTIVDDLALPLDGLRLRASGSAAGHNGLRDIEATLGTQAYPRLRFGIGNDYPKGHQADFVLGRWHPQEIPLVQEKIQRSVELIEQMPYLDWPRLMSSVNAWKPAGPEAG
jgi:PTH1 family peptidyl-tRNA hydrolase